MARGEEISQSRKTGEWTSKRKGFEQTWTEELDVTRKYAYTARLAAGGRQVDGPVSYIDMQAGRCTSKQKPTGTQTHKQTCRTMTRQPVKQSVSQSVTQRIL